LAGDFAHAGRGDIDRLLTEWRSFLKNLAAAAPLTPGLPFATEPLRARWDEARILAARLLDDARAHELPDLPPLTPEQKRPVHHRLSRAVALDRPAPAYAR
jgi:hypothetical protein